MHPVHSGIGDVDNRVRAIARQLGFKTVIWSNEWDTQDWQLEEHTITPKEIVDIFKKDLQSLPERDNGVITLEHDGHPAMTTMARTILDMGIAKGMKPMHIAQCLGDIVGYNAVPSTTTTTTNNKPDSVIINGSQQQQPQKHAEQKDSNDNKEKTTEKPTDTHTTPSPKSSNESNNGDSSISKEIADTKTKASGSSQSSYATGFSIACWTVVTVAASVAF